MLRRVMLVLAAVGLVLGIGVSPASANAEGNYAQGWTWFSCSRDVVGSGSDIKGSLAVHYNHSANHSDKPYGTYLVLDHLTGYSNGSVRVDTDIRYVGSSTWHHQSTNYLNASLGYSDGWIFDYPASYSPSGGYARWQVTWGVNIGGEWGTRTCQVPGSGTLTGSWNTGVQYGAP